ncbi:hypothetical protein [Longispora albida]|uniref:hypothetical protein n=1 Tax=Longispora albida TaxID=203523 RepID=UPI000360CA70|nr:hypothetical protein [Longispora albida]
MHVGRVHVRHRTGHGRYWRRIRALAGWAATAFLVSFACGLLVASALVAGGWAW